MVGGLNTKCNGDNLSCALSLMRHFYLCCVQPNLMFKRDNTPANYGSLFDDSGVVSIFDFSWGVTP